MKNKQKIPKAKIRAIKLNKKVFIKSPKFIFPPFVIIYLINDQSFVFVASFMILDHDLMFRFT